MLKSDVLHRINESVLCWLATSSSAGLPNVSPKEAFCPFQNDSIIIANIASPRSAQNINENPWACVSFINIFTQRGYQISGRASCLDPSGPEYPQMQSLLHEITQGHFPFSTIFRVHADELREVIAPRYRLYPGTTEADQIASAMKCYGVQPRSG